jgi:hypothetical protein
MVVLVALAVLCLGCSVRREPWAIEVYNNSTSPTRIRIEAGGTAGEWLLLPDQIAVLMRRNQPTGGTLSVIDPTSCLVLAEAAFDEAPGMLVTVNLSVTGDGSWEIVAGADDPNTTAQLFAPAGSCAT